MGGKRPHGDAPRATKYNGGGGLERLVRSQESVASRCRELGLCSFCSRAAAEGRPLMCNDRIEIKEKADNGEA